MRTMKIIGSPLYQWEVGRQLEIIPMLNMRVDSVHFCHCGDLEALVVKPKTENGMIIADIPNILLQSGSNIVAYSVNVSADCVETIQECVFSVRERAKPADYVYTETEVFNFSKLSAQIGNLQQLKTDAKGSLVDAINEVYDRPGGGSISAIDQGDAIIIETSFPVKGQGDAIIIGGV